MVQFAAMIPALATLVAAYVAFRMLEVFCFARERYGGKFEHHAVTVLAFLVLLLTGAMMFSIYSAELATTSELNAERFAAASLAQALRDAQNAPPVAPAPAPSPRRKNHPQHATGWVERVIDGDTFVLNTGERIRILGIDAPELADPGGPAARDFLLAMIDSTVVRLERKGKDRYGRTLAEIFLVKDGRSIAKALLDSQNATPYPAK